MRHGLHIVGLFVLAAVGQSMEAYAQNDEANTIEYSNQAQPIFESDDNDDFVSIKPEMLKGINLGKSSRVNAGVEILGAKSADDALLRRELEGEVRRFKQLNVTPNKNLASGCVEGDLSCILKKHKAAGNDVVLLGKMSRDGRQILFSSDLYNTNNEMKLGAASRGLQPKSDGSRPSLGEHGSDLNRGASFEAFRDFFDALEKEREAQLRAARMSQGKMQSSPGPKINGKQLLPKQKIASNNPSGNPEDSQEQNSAGSGKDFLSKLLNNPLLHTILKWLLLLLLLFALLRWILSWFRRRNMLSARNIPTFDGSSNIERDNRTVGVNNSNSGDGTAGRNSNGSDEETQTAVTKAPGSVYQQSGYSEVKEKWFRRGSNFFSWLLILGLLLLLLLLTLAFAKFLPAFVAHFPAFGVQEKLFDLPQLDSTQKRVIYFLIGILFGLIVFFLFRLIFAPVRGFDNIPQKLSTGLARMYIWSSVTRVASVSVALIPGIVLLGIALAMAKKSANFEQSNSIVMAAISVLFVGLIFVVYHTLSTLVLDRIFADDKHREEKEEVLLHCREKGLDISEETVEFQLSKAARSCMGCTYGGLLMKPRIAIAPNANSLGQSPEERRQLALAVVAHEFAHIQRRDVILSQLTTVLRWIPFLRGLWSAESRATEILTDITAALSSPDIARALHRLFIRLQKSTGSSANRDNTTHPALTKRAAVMSDIIEFNANTGQKDDASPELSYMFRLWLWTFLGAALLVFFVWFIVELKKAREYTPRYEEIVEKWKESEQKRNKSNPAEENK